jgi:hypothetical protein
LTGTPYKKRGIAASFFVPRTRLELAHRNRNQPLKLACLPISPPGQVEFCSGLRAQGKNLSALRSVHCALRLFGAQNRTRTCTSLLTLVPETSASTNFAIWALITHQAVQASGPQNKEPAALISIAAGAKVKIFSKHEKNFTEKRKIFFVSYLPVGKSFTLFLSSKKRK